MRSVPPLAALTLFVCSCSGAISPGMGGDRGQAGDPHSPTRAGEPRPVPGTPVGPADPSMPASATPPGTAMPPGAPTAMPAPTPPGTSVIPPAPGKPAEGGASPRPLQRLTRQEYDNTIRDLLGESRAGAGLPPDTAGAHGFELAPPVSVLDATALQESAERLAAAAVTKSLAKLVPCKAPPGDDDCARKFIASFGRRAFRRPLAADEQAALEALYANARAALAYDFTGGVRVVLTAFLQSPELLYHWELGGAAQAVSGKTIALGPFEVASRLSYLFTATMPDDELLAAAESGALATPDGVAAQARRLVASPRARDGIGTFFRQWWDLDRIRQTDKGSNITGWDGARDPMYAETVRFIEATVLEGDGTMKTLLTAPYTFVASSTLAKIYGVTAPAAQAGVLPRVELPPAERAGFLTQGSFLAAQAAPTETSPVKRGHLVLSRLLCTKLPDPPADVPPLPAASGTLKTMRQRTREHGLNPGCAGCHRDMDALGLAFEHYDTAGRFRPMEKTEAIDASGGITLDGAGKTFTNGVELARLLGGSNDVAACAARQLLRFALGRSETAADEPALTEIERAVTGGNLRDVLLALVRTSAFRHRSPAAGEVLP